jgi:hypothetical protein
VTYADLFDTDLDALADVLGKARAAALEAQQRQSSTVDIADYLRTAGVVQTARLPGG